MTDHKAQMSDWIHADAPSNIALIKYMGKVSVPSSNLSANASLSWTLGHLKTRVRVRWESSRSVKHLWRPLENSQTSALGSSMWHAPVLSAAGQERYLRHADRCLVRIKAHMESLGLRPNVALGETLVVESANGFPSDCGLASSASSFAALTLAVARLLGFNTETDEHRIWLAGLSREGSGSSCRSFFTPWSIWDEEGARAVVGLPSEACIRHLALIVDDSKKMVSSSEAHVRVATSDLFQGRIERAEKRLSELVKRLSDNHGCPSVENWNKACDLTWIEFWDMHALFETSKPPFGYFTPGTIAVLEWIRAYQNRTGPDVRLPMVTMDAGPNIHLLLWREDESQQKFVDELRAFVQRSHVARLIDSDAIEN